MKDIKKIAAIIVSALFIHTAHSQVYQIPNSGFEQWESTSSDAEPVNWNTFGTADCNLSGIYAMGCGTAKTNHHEKKSGGRPGTAGSYYLNIYSTYISIASTVANGNMTLGKINIGSSTPTDASNYNYTIRNNTDFSQSFTATPDSLYVWVRASAQTSNQKARVSCYIHGNMDFKDPADNSVNNYAGKAVLEFPIDNNAGWEQLKIPFIYDGNAQPAYIIVSLTNNAQPGGGSANDYLDVDDLELVYSAWLNDIKVNGTSISGFSKTNFNYSLTLPVETMDFPSLSYTSEVSDVTVKIDTVYGSNPNKPVDGGKTIITVTAEDGVTKKIYTINYSVPVSTNANLADLKINGVSVQNFNKTVILYDTLYPHGVVNMPTITYQSESKFASVKMDTVFGNNPYFLLDSAKTIITVTAEDGVTKKIYTVNHHITIGRDAWLTNLSINGTTVSGFDRQILTYDTVYPRGTSLFPTVSYAYSTHATLVHDTVFTQNNKLDSAKTIITVTSEDRMTTHIYTLNHYVYKSDVNTLGNIGFTLSGTDTLYVNGFNSQVTTYNVKLADTTTQIPVINYVLANDTGERISITQPTTPDGGKATIVVTAENGSQRVYELFFSTNISTNAYLSKIWYDTTELKDFDKDILEHTVILPPGTKQIPTITATPEWVTANVSVIPFNAFPGTATIIVTAEDTNVVKTYLIHFEVDLSTNDSLSDIKINNVSLPDFDESVFEYTVSLRSGTVNIPKVKTVTQWNMAHTLIFSTDTLPGTTTILVIAEDTNYKREYRVHFSYLLDTNAFLADIKIDNIGISDFDKEVYEYFVSLSPGSTQLPSVQAIPEGKMIDIQTIIPDTLPCMVSILVTAEDTNYKNLYTIHFDVEQSKDVSLADLQINGKTLSSFSKTKTTYELELLYDETDILLSATPTWKTAEVQIWHTDTFPGTTTILVTAEDTNYKQIYTVHFNVEKADNAFLAQMMIDSMPMLNFHKNIFCYEYVLPTDETQLPFVEALPEDQRAVVQIKQATSANDTAFVTITAFNQENIVTYMILFTTQLRENAKLSQIKVDGTPLADFNPNLRNYRCTLSVYYNKIPDVEVELADKTAAYYIKNATNIPGQTIINVCAEDGFTTLTYRINFAKANKIETFGDNFALKVYPNPAKDFVKIEIEDFSSNCEIQVLDILGKCLMTKKITNHQTVLDLQEFSEGIYFLRVVSDKKIITTEKIVKTGK